MFNRLKFIGCLFMGAVLAGCGGGDGTFPQPAPFSISGTAAVGRALSGSLVEARCKAGSGRSITDASGRFAITFEASAQPCILRVTDPLTGQRLHSVVESRADLAHITPFTELVAARVLGFVPSEAFDGFTAGISDKITADTVLKAMAELRSELLPITDLSNIDLQKTAFQPATDAVAGDAIDHKIETLMTSLNFVNKTIIDLSRAAAQPGTPFSKAVNDVFGEAVNGLEYCPAIRSGDYWFLSADGSLRRRFSLDVKTLKGKTREAIPVDVNLVVVPEIVNQTTTLPTPCRLTVRFADEPNTNDLYIASGGFAFSMRPMVGLAGTLKLDGIMVPAQQLALNDLAGAWDGFYLSPSSANSDNYLPLAFRADYDGQGKATYLKCVGQPVYCTQPVQNNVTGLFNEQGLLDRSDGASAIVYRSTNGDLVMLSSQQQGILIEAKRAKPLTLPRLGTRIATYEWEARLPWSAYQFLAEQAYTVSATDPVTNKVTLTQDVTNDVSTYSLNAPRTGMKFFPNRALAPSTVKEFVGIGGQGWQINVTAAADPNYTPFSAQWVIEKTPRS